MPTMVTPIGHGALPIAISRYASLACDETVMPKTNRNAVNNQSINQLFYLQTQMYHNGHMQYRDP